MPFLIVIRKPNWPSHLKLPSLHLLHKKYLGHTIYRSHLFHLLHLLSHFRNQSLQYRFAHHQYHQFKKPRDPWTFSHQYTLLTSLVLEVKVPQSFQESLQQSHSTSLLHWEAFAEILQHSFRRQSPPILMYHRATQPRLQMRLQRLIDYSDCHKRRPVFLKAQCSSCLWQCCWFCTRHS